MSGFRDQRCQELDCIGEVGHNGIGDRIINVIEALHGYRLLAGFFGLQRAEARFFSRIVKSRMLLQSEERNNIV